MTASLDYIKLINNFLVWFQCNALEMCMVLYPAFPPCVQCFHVSCKIDGYISIYGIFKLTSSQIWVHHIDMNTKRGQAQTSLHKSAS